MCPHTHIALVFAWVYIDMYVHVYIYIYICGYMCTCRYICNGGSTKRAHRRAAEKTAGPNDACPLMG